jgi:hypothetical protein
VDDVQILWPVVSSEVERLVAKYKIDFIDCFQIVTIKQPQTASWRRPLAQKALGCGNAPLSPRRVKVGIVLPQSIALYFFVVSLARYAQ